MFIKSIHYSIDFHTSNCVNKRLDFKSKDIKYYYGLSLSKALFSDLNKFYITRMNV